LGNLITPPKVQKLQKALYEKAKRQPNYRFYSLFDKLYRPDVIEFAYRKAKANGGSPGVDGETFEKIEEKGRDEWLGNLAEELKSGEYTPGAVRRVYIPKANGKTRPLGIPNVRDRVIQTAAVIVLGSVFEADMPEEQFAYRENGSAKDAAQKVQCLLNRDRYLQVVDGDLTGYFDNIPHPELMKSIARRISDGRILGLVKMWLEAPVEEIDKKTGRRVRTTFNKDNRVGIPQGAPISPLMSNIYFRRFIIAWKKLGYDKRFWSKIVNYADDFVICCRKRASEALEVAKYLFKCLKLSINEDKTKVCILPGDSFTFFRV
jgi:group II intron reverse transcriptase/maturase